LILINITSLYIWKLEQVNYTDYRMHDFVMYDLKGRVNPLKLQYTPDPVIKWKYFCVKNVCFHGIHVTNVFVCFTLLCIV